VNASNPWEQNARALKTGKLVLALDALCPQFGLDPMRRPLEVAQRLRAAMPKFWDDLAAWAKCNAPSPLTRREVIGIYLSRASENQRRAEPEPTVHGEF
jgi:hypothetical protein